MSAITIDHLNVDFVSADPGRPINAVNDVSLSVDNGEIFGIVGESGCGKSTLANAIMGLLPATAAVTGSVMLGDRQLLGLDDRALRSLRGNDLSMIFQDASVSLDPTWPVGDQIAETIRAHAPVSRRQAKELAIALMSKVGILDAAARYGEPPHRLSGGMRQRIVIASALANDPDLLIADEPTTALDVTIQAQILELIRRLRTDSNRAIILITHDLGVVAELCDRVGVMYAGQLVEVAPVEQLFSRPRHPYTQALLAASPGAVPVGERLVVVPGQVPNLSDPPAGCRFSTRCPRRVPQCDEKPPLAPLGSSLVACWNPAPLPNEVAA